MKIVFETDQFECMKLTIERSDVHLKMELESRLGTQTLLLNEKELYQLIGALHHIQKQIKQKP